MSSDALVSETKKEDVVQQEILILNVYETVDGGIGFTLNPKYPIFKTLGVLQHVLYNLNSSLVGPQTS